MRCLAVCKPIGCVSPPAALDYVLHTQVRPRTEQNNRFQCENTLRFWLPVWVPVHPDTLYFEIQINLAKDHEEEAAQSCRGSHQVLTARRSLVWVQLAPFCVEFACCPSGFSAALWLPSTVQKNMQVGVIGSSHLSVCENVLVRLSPVIAGGGSNPSVA